MSEYAKDALPVRSGQEGCVPTLTIALPVFNGGNELVLAVQSVLLQSFWDWELLILDDGSTDGAVERLETLSDHRVLVIRDGLNKGLAARLNEAVERARGRYFARMDHDDICHPERFARQIAFLEGHPSTDLLAVQCVTMDEQEKITGALPCAILHEDICKRPWLGFYLPHPSWTGKTSWFKVHRYRSPAPYCSEDQELLLRASEVSAYHTLPSYLLAYRVRSYTTWRKLWKTRWALSRVQCSHFYGRRRYREVVLSLAVTVLRIAGDAARKSAPFVGLSRSRYVGGALSEEERQYWNMTIAKLKNSIDGWSLSPTEITRGPVAHEVEKGLSTNRVSR